MPWGPSEKPRTPLAIPIPVFRSRLLTTATIKGLGTFEDKTPGDPTKPIEKIRSDRRALAAIFDQHRERLWRKMELRLDPRPQAPTRAARRAERPLRVQEAIIRLNPIDREALALRQFQQPNGADAAQGLGTRQEGGAKRDFRILKPRSLKNAAARSDAILVLSLPFRAKGDI